MSITCKFHVSFLLSWECWLRNQQKLFAELGHEVMVLESKTQKLTNQSLFKKPMLQVTHPLSILHKLCSLHSWFTVYTTHIYVSPNSSLCEFPPTHLNLLILLPPRQSSREMAWRKALKMSDGTLELSLRLFS